MKIDLKKTKMFSLFMSKPHKKISERTDVASIFISLMIVSILTFITPGSGIFYWSDIYILLGMMAGLYYILKKENSFRERVKNTLVLTFIGGIITGLDLTVITILIAFTLNKAFQYPLTLLYLWTGYILLTQMIIAAILIALLSIKEKNYVSANSE